MNMTLNKLEELKRLTDAATPGEWEALLGEPGNEHHEDFWVVSKSRLGIGISVFDTTDINSANNARFIAAFNPATASALLALAGRALEPQGQVDYASAQPGGNGDLSTLALEYGEADVLPQLQKGHALPETKAWLVDFPDEPELGFYFSEEENKLARSRALVLLDDVLASQLALPAGPVPERLKPEDIRALAKKYNIQCTSRGIMEHNDLMSFAHELSAVGRAFHINLESQGQMQPVAYRYKPRPVPGFNDPWIFVADLTSEQASAMRENGCTIEPLYASQLALPAGPVPLNEQVIVDAAEEFKEQVPGSSVFHRWVFPTKSDLIRFASVFSGAVQTPVAYEFRQGATQMIHPVGSHYAKLLIDKGWNPRSLGYVDSPSPAVAQPVAPFDPVTLRKAKLMANDGYQQVGVIMAKQGEPRAYIDMGRVTWGGASVAQPVADEREAFQGWIKSKKLLASEPMWISWQARAALGQPAEEGGKS